MSWQNSRELQLGPNKTFKSKLWSFDNTLPASNNTSAPNSDESTEAKNSNEFNSKQEARKAYAKFKYTASNFALFQKEFFKDVDEEEYDEKQVNDLKQMMSKKHEDGEDDDDDVDDGYEEDDDDKIEDGIIDYDEIEDNEILNNLINQQNNTVASKQYSYSVTSQSNNYEPDATCISSGKKSQGNYQTNYYVNTLDSSNQYNVSQGFYQVDSSSGYDPIKKYHYVYETHSTGSIVNQENYDYNSYVTNKSPYNLTSLQNSSYMPQQTDLNDYSSFSASNYNNNMNTYYTTSSANYAANVTTSTSSTLCNYYNMNNLNDNINTTNDFNSISNQNFYQSY